MNEISLLTEYICRHFTFSNIISLAAIIISFFSLRYVLIKDRRLKVLREDKSVLYPLLHENYDYFLQDKDKFKPERISHILNLLKTERLHSKSLQLKIDKIKEAQLVYLEHDGKFNALNADVEDLFIEIRYYLAEVIP